MGIEEIPGELRERQQWVLWRYEERDKKKTKVPYYYDGNTGSGYSRARSNQPNTWDTFESVLARAKDFEGIGFMLSEADPYCFIDFDGCQAEVEGKKFSDSLEARKARAKAWIQRFSSYSEWSPSKAGAHVIVKASVPRGRNSQSLGLEIYDCTRFVTMTGARFSENGIVETQAEVDAFLAEFFPEPEATPQQAMEVRDDDDQVLAWARSPSFDKLYAGEHNCSSHSDADFALCAELSKHTRDPAQIERLWGRSKLAERPKFKRADYRTLTIEKAMASTPVAESKPTWSGAPPELAREPDILERFVADYGNTGIVGENLMARLVYLALASRLLPWEPSLNARPVSLLPKGSSSTGKNATVDGVLLFFTEDADYINLGGMSRRFLNYLETSFEHKILIFPEWALIKDDEELVATVRVLLSEGVFRHGTVDASGNHRPEARMIEKRGPSGLIMPTTAVMTEPELETRCLSPRTDDSRDQTRRVLERQGGNAELSVPPTADIDLDAWHALQQWLAAGSNRTVIPYGRALGRVMPAVSPRMRRDFPSLLCLIRAHTLLHRASRRKDEHGAAIATLDDYRVVREIASHLLAEGNDAHVSDAIRETITAVAGIIEEEGKAHATVPEIGRRLGIGKAAYDRVKRAVHDGYLENENEGRRGYKLKLGSPLPDEDTFLPPPETLHPLGGS